MAPPTSPNMSTYTTFMTNSKLPMARRYLTTWTPTVPPAMPPIRMTSPILKSTLPSRQWAKAPEEAPATIWLESEAAATAGGMPTIINKGVSKKPPPTPKSPERNPTSPPAPRMMKKLMLIPAMGRYISILPAPSR